MVSALKFLAFVSFQMWAPSFCSWTWTGNSSFRTSWWILRCASWVWQWLRERGLWAVWAWAHGEPRVLVSSGWWWWHHMLRTFLRLGQHLTLSLCHGHSRGTASGRSGAPPGPLLASTFLHPPPLARPINSALPRPILLTQLCNGHL